MRVIERPGKLTEKECNELGAIWRLGRNGFLDLDPTFLAKILETCTETFVAEIEALLVEALEEEEMSNLSSPSSGLPSLLVRTVATSQPLFVKAVQIFSKYLLEFDWNSKLLLLYQSFVSSILSSSSNPIQLYPCTSQSLASLLLTFRDLAMFGRGEEMVELLVEAIKKSGYEG